MNNGANKSIYIYLAQKINQNLVLLIARIILRIFYVFLRSFSGAVVDYLEQRWSDAESKPGAERIGNERNDLHPHSNVFK